MSDFTRRTFLRGLSSAFGAATMPDLHKSILDNGAPILLEPQLVANTLHAYKNGNLLLGDHTAESFTRPSWRDYFVEIGARTSKDVARHASEWFVDDVDQFIGDDQWEEIYELHYDPMPAAYHLLKRLKIGPKTEANRPRNGRLDFYAGSNHPGSNDLWVEAADDFTVSLLQARLLELHQPIKIIMETPTIIKDDSFDHDSEPTYE
jgi:hypothetical protein